MIFPILDEFSLFLVALHHIYVLLQVFIDCIDDKIILYISYCLFLFYRSLREKWVEKILLYLKVESI